MWKYLIAAPLWGLHEHLLVVGLRADGQLGGEGGQGGLVGGHADSQGSKVVELVGQTNGATVHVHEVAGLAWPLVDLKDTLAHHGHLEAVHEVLAEAHRPTVANLHARSDVLVHETVDGSLAGWDLEGLAGEDSANLVTTHAETLSREGLDGTEGTDSLEEVTDGGQVAAVAMANGVHNLVGGSHGVGLEGQVVVGDLLAIGADGGEQGVGGTVDSGGQLDLEVALDVLLVLSDTLLDGLAASLTHHDGTGQALVEVSLGSSVEVLVEGVVGGIAVLEAVDDTSDASDVTLGTLGTGGNSGGEHDDLALEVVGGDSEGGSTHEGLAGLLEGGHLLVQGLGGLGEVHGETLTAAGSTGTGMGDLGVQGLGEGGNLVGGGGLVLVHEDLELATGTGRLGVLDVGELHDAGDLAVDTEVDTVPVGALGDGLTGHPM